MYNAFDLKIIKKNKLQNTLKVLPLSLCVLLDFSESATPLSQNDLSQYLGEMLFIK